MQSIIIKDIIQKLDIKKQVDELKESGRLATTVAGILKQSRERFVTEEKRVLFKQLEQALFSEFAIEPIQGTTLFEEALRLTKVLCTDCKWEYCGSLDEVTVLFDTLYILFYSIDELLDGGIFTGEMTEIFGPPSSGKTQLALTLTANVISTLEVNVLYLDTTCSFQSQRLHEIITSKIDVESQPVLKSMLSRVQCIRSFDVFDVISQIETVKSKLASESDDFCLHLKLIVLDSIASIITPILGGKQTQGHALMTKIGLLLKEIAYEYGIAVLVINNAVGNYNDSMVGGTIDKYKPSLGKWWLNIPHVRLFMDCNGNHKRDINERSITVLKNPRFPNRRSTSTIYLRKEGVSENVKEDG